MKNNNFSKADINIMRGTFWNFPNSEKVCCEN